MEDKELKVKSIRADDDTYEKFKKIATNEFGNQGQCLASLINLYETETAKVALVERKLEIESFQDYLNKIGGLFLTSLQLNNDAEGRIRDEFARQLISKDKSIEDLQNKINKLESDKIGITEAYNNTVVENEKCANRVDELTESNNNIKALIEEYKAKNDMLLGQMKRYEKYPEQLETTKELLSDAQAKSIDKDNIIKDKEFTINNLVKDTDKLKSEHIKEIDTITNDKDLSISGLTKNQEKLIQEHQEIIIELNNKHNADIQQLKVESLKELENLKKENQLNIKLSVAEIKEELNNKLNQEQQKHNIVVETYQAKYKSLLEELEQIRNIPKTKTTASKKDTESSTK